MTVNLYYLLGPVCFLLATYDPLIEILSCWISAPKLSCKSRDCNWSANYSFARDIYTCETPVGPFAKTWGYYFWNDDFLSVSNLLFSCSCYSFRRLIANYPALCASFVCSSACFKSMLDNLYAF
jgi:hypothetical protein